jgi:hypothetical protein
MRRLLRFLSFAPPMLLLWWFMFFKTLAHPIAEDRMVGTIFFHYLVDNAPIGQSAYIAIVNENVGLDLA